MMASTKTSKEKRTILKKTCSGVEKTKRLQLQAQPSEEILRN
jgi:hypothetical protein